MHLRFRTGPRAVSKARRAPGDPVAGRCARECVTSAVLSFPTREARTCSSRGQPAPWGPAGPSRESLVACPGSAGLSELLTLGSSLLGA